MMAGYLREDHITLRIEVPDGPPERFIVAYEHRAANITDSYDRSVNAPVGVAGQRPAAPPFLGPSISAMRSSSMPSRLYGPASLALTSWVGVQGMAAAYGAGGLTMATTGSLAAATVLGAGVVGIVGLATAGVWVLYEMSTTASDPEFPLRKLSAFNNPFGVATFTGSVLVGNSLEDAVDHAQYASDLRSVWKLRPNASAVKPLRLDLASGARINSGYKALGRLAQNPLPKTSGAPAPGLQHKKPAH